MRDWFILAFIAFVCYGLFGFIPKLTTEHISARSVFVYETLGTFFVGLIVFCFILRFNIETKPLGGVLGSFSIGVIGAIGTFCFFLAISRKDVLVSVVVPMIALYPVVTLLLAWLILREPITLKNLIGILLAFTR